MGPIISGTPPLPSAPDARVELTPDRFEAFDEPWKVEFNQPGKAWEDKWGLMDSARKLKPGIKIPDCGGKTAS